ncbi:ferredoxin [Anaerococcus cruorum]|uniref:ferredoxin n=1 Tax=Anaerococcus sp. WGS1596 TaxID=3366806 RepID=UPI00372CFC35
MKFFVDQDECIGCGMCENICPDVFSMNDDNVSEAINGDIAEEFIESALEAEESCPVSCISHEE